MARLRLKNIVFLLFLFLFIGIGTSSATAQGRKKFKVVLDAGHGGHDGGARGYGGYREKDIALAITRKVGALIRQKHKDVEIIYTRTSDVFIPLDERARIANRNRADLFISIHCNASRRTGAYGTETFVLGLHKAKENMEIAKRENSVIYLEDNFKERYENFNPSSIEDIIGMTLSTSQHLDNSIRFAELTQNEFVSHSKRFSRGVKQAGFLVLRKTTMPSVLIETGFITNPEEGDYLNLEFGQKKIAESIYFSFKKYKNEVQGNPSSNTRRSAAPKRGAKTKGKVYKIQFLTSKNKYTSASPQLRQMKGKKIDVIKSGTLYRYYYGSTSYEQEKKTLLKEVQAYGFPDAFIVTIDTNAKSKKGYSILLLSSKQKYASSDRKFKGYRIKRYRKNGLFEYQTGHVKTYKEAQLLLNEAKDKGFKQAFILTLD